MLSRSLATWAAGGRDPDRFPYDDVLDEYHRVGKHFVAAQQLAALAAVRDGLADDGTRSPAAARLRAFLDVVLDKHDKRYDYVSYTALVVLGLVDPTTRQPVELPRERTDRLLVGLTADALGFELDPHVPLPRMRPDRATVAKRCRLGLRVLAPALDRLGIAGPSSSDVMAGAAEVVAAVRATQQPADRWLLRVTMLPVDTVHDEYLFIRVLQSFETFFVAMCRQLRLAIDGLDAGRWSAVAAGLDRCAAGFRQAAPLFSLLATMQPVAFRTFRQFTDGASAIQSVAYKTMESLCRRPAPQRLDSVAYYSVPSVRAAVLAGTATVEEALRGAVTTGRLGGADEAAVRKAMGRLAGAYQRWRQTHVRLATRMLGEATGTGYTEGVPYLRSVLGTPLFTLSDVAESP